MAVNGKVILKVKSGPGVIIGDTERDIIDNEVRFTGIEFDEPGDYVISVTSTSPDVDNTEFSVTVLEDSSKLEQPSSPDKDDSKPAEVPKTIIAQVDKTSVDLPGMEFDKSDSEKDDKLVASQIGITPFVNYMGSPINDKDISSLRLFHDGIIPVVQITFHDSNNTIKSVGFPQDDTKFEVFFSSRSNNLKSIHLKFKIEEFTTLKSGNYSMYGTLDISDLYRIKYQTYNGTSYEVLRDISKELKLGFNSNITNTDDKMPWRNVGDKQYDFIDNVIKHSYLSEQSYMVGFIDYYYCFNYVDVEKEMKRDNKDDKCINTSSIPDGKTTDDVKIVPLQLSTDKAMNAGNTFIIEKNFENNSTSLSLKDGYKTKTKYYDKTKKMFLVFDVDSTTSDESKSLILKGAKGDKEAFDNNITTTYAGKIDTDNVHKNYNYAITQNKINIDNLNKMVLTVEIPNLNFSLYLYQKVNVLIVNAEPATATNKESIQWRKSGDYIISEINFNWNGISFKQELKLIRKELGKNPEEINEGTPPSAPKDVKDPKQENPAPPDGSEPIVLSPPNSIYVVGDVYTVENSDGSRFLLTVTNVLANGTDITAKISQINKDSDLGITSKTPIDGEFLFNVEKNSMFVGNSNIGELAIIGKGEIYENTSNTEIDEDVIDAEYTEGEFQGDEEVAFEVFFKDTQSTEGAVEDVYTPSTIDNNDTSVVEQATGSLYFDGKKFLQPEVSKRYPTNYILYIDSKKVPKPKLTKQGLINTKLKVEGGLTGDPSDSAAKSGYCPTLKKGKKYHTNKGITYAVWKVSFGTNNDDRFLTMNLADWSKIFDSLYWDKNATSKYEAVNCLLTSFAWGGNKPKTLEAAKKLLNVSNIDDVSVEKAVAALISARAQFFVNISQPDNKNNKFRKGWINAVNAFVTQTYF